LTTKNSVSPQPPPSPATAAITTSPSAQNITKSPPNLVEVENLKKQLRDSELTINEMRGLIEKLAMENSVLKTRIDSQPIPAEVQLWVYFNDFFTSWNFNIINFNDFRRVLDSPPSNEKKSFDVSTSSDEPIVSSSTASAKRPVSMYEARQAPRNEEIRPPVTQSLYSVASNSTTSSSSSIQLPLVEEVTKRTEVVTRRIQELWLAMQDLTKKDPFVPCSERIRIGVADLIAIFPNLGDEHEILKNALRQLNVNTTAIQTECANLQRALTLDGPSNVEVHLQAVRNCAYNLAKATKTLVTQFQWNEKNL
jgi:G protein-coupled receptor kinase interactor 2